MEVFEELAHGTPPLLGSQLSALCRASADAKACRELCTQQYPRYQQLVALLTHALNHDEMSKNKLAALATLTNFAKHKIARDELYKALKNIDTMFEETLREKAESAESFGTALGKLHSTMLVFMMRVFGYHVRGAELFEYANNKMSFALDLLVEVFKVPTYEPELTANCCTALLDMCTPTKGATEDVRQFQARIELIIDNVMKHNIIAVASTAIKDHLKKTETSGGIMGNAIHASINALVKTILNLYTYSSQGTTASALRQSLLVWTDLISQTLVGYMNLSVREIERCLDTELATFKHPILPILPHGILTALKCMAFGTFHLGHHAKNKLLIYLLRSTNSFFASLFALPIQEFIVNHLDLYAVLLHYNVNIDSLAGEHSIPDDIVIPEACKSAAHLRSISQLLSALPREDIEALWRTLATNSMSIPLARDNLSFDLLAHLVDESIAREGVVGSPPDTILKLNCDQLDEVALALDKRMEALEQDNPEVAPLRKEVKEAKEKEKETPKENLRLLGDLPTLGPPGSAAAAAPPSAVAVPASPSSPDDIDTSTAIPALRVQPSKAQEVWATAGQGAGDVPKEFLCAINGHLLRHPVTAPSGHTFEKETIDIWLTKVGSTNPLTGETLKAEDLKPDEALEVRILNWHIDKNSAANANTEEEDDMYAF
eukprot:TRINITY_DN6516_c0_g6_i1.p1 TRINITY_DN6516_c0_g6~~TRINITY_DN6516_c0_g6_i1.p1  ORF type:complete len:662 (+),score=240.79 TRINITY_DN6516_c0_g6_i1:152-2137(+)